MKNWIHKIACALGWHYGDDNTGIFRCDHCAYVGERRKNPAWRTSPICIGHSDALFTIEFDGYVLAEIIVGHKNPLPVFYIVRVGDSGMLEDMGDQDIGYHWSGINRWIPIDEVVE